MIKNIPLGIDNYIDANEKYYVDKTLIIKDIIDNSFGRPLLITRPRRFGKSLMVSTLEYFFTNKGDYYYAFKDKKILKDAKYKDYLNKYPVIHLNMKDVSSTNYDDLINMTTNIIAETFRNFPELKSMNYEYDYEKNKYLSIANKIYTNPLDYVDSIKFLSSLLYKKYNKKVVVLIDEYDTPLETSYQNGFYDKSIQFFKRFYSTSLKSNDNVLFSFTTGVLQIGKESIFSELNNLSTFDVLNENFQEYFGFTKQETIDILNNFNLKYDISTVSKYYGGYGTKNVEIYNPWSILNLIENETFYPYWVNTGSNTTLSNLIKSVPNGINILNEFINNSNLTFDFNNSLSYNDIKQNKETLFSYLLQSGYLVGRKTGNIFKINLYIPNLEINYVFENELIIRNSNNDVVALASNFRTALLEGNTEEITNFLSRFIESSFSYYDLTREKEYQIMVSTLLSVFFTDYLIKNEVNNTYGRCDILMMPKNHSNIGLIIEIKSYKGRLSKTNLTQYAESALNQIIDHKYYSELKNLNINKILLYGIAFNKNNIAIEHAETK